MRKIGREDLLGNPDYDTPEARLPHLEEIFALIEEWTLTKTKWEAFGELNAINVPCGPVLQHQGPDRGRGPARGGHARRRRASRPRHLHDGRLPVHAVRLAREVKRSPLLGEHNAEILQELLDAPDGELERLTEAGVV